jgi:hypothetical protein
MGADGKARELRELLSVARKLRAYALQTEDKRYVSLFLETAESLEARAWAIAYDAPPPGSRLHIDLTC